jgi:hypothetical protein
MEENDEIRRQKLVMEQKKKSYQFLLDLENIRHKHIMEEMEFMSKNNITSFGRAEVEKKGQRLKHEKSYAYGDEWK